MRCIFWDFYEFTPALNVSGLLIHMLNFMFSFVLVFFGFVRVYYKYTNMMYSSTGFTIPNSCTYLHTYICSMFDPHQRVKTFDIYIKNAASKIHMCRKWVLVVCYMNLYNIFPSLLQLSISLSHNKGLCSCILEFILHAFSFFSGTGN